MPQLPPLARNAGEINISQVKTKRRPGIKQLVEEYSYEIWGTLVPPRVSHELWISQQQGSKDKSFLSYEVKQRTLEKMYLIQKNWKKKEFHFNKGSIHKNSYKYLMVRTENIKKLTVDRPNRVSLVIEKYVCTLMQLCTWNIKEYF